MENKKPTQFLMKPKVDFCFKELMEDEEVRNAFLAAVLGINLKEINESKILPSHLRQKDKDDKLGILNFIMFDDEEYYCRFHFWSDKGRKLYSDKFEIHTLELPKLAKHDYPETELLKWLQFINAETEEEFEMADKKLKVTLIKSTIGAVPKNKKTIEALGLTKLYKTVELPDNAATAGALRKVAPYVKVEEA